MARTDGQTRDIRTVAADLGFGDDDIELHGRHRVKVRLDALDHPPDRRGHYVLVTAITPSGPGIGKTVTAIALAMGLERIGARAAVTLRQSALGPTLGMKGGGGGGGAARVVPLDECLLGLGSDTSAVEGANNLLAAVVDDAIFRGADIDPTSVTWQRVLDVDDRALRHVVVGLGGRLHGVPRESGFDITAASEVMAILGLSRDLADLRTRLDAVVPAWDRAGAPVTGKQLGAAGAMAALLRHALQPNLMQTSEGTPAFVHAGPFGNIATGNSSVVADLLALPRVDYLVTEAGFGSDLGAEKFFHLKCLASGLDPDAVVLVATVPGLRSLGGATAAGPDPAAVAAGTANLRRHVEILRAFGVPVVVALNRVPSDDPEEVAITTAAALEAGAASVASHTGYVEGGAGTVELAEAVAAACRGPVEVQRLYRPEDATEDKVRTLATRVYGAADVAWDLKARRALDRLRDAGYGDLPVCVAKTHLSLSHDPTLNGAPSGFTLPVRDVRLAAGAGFLTIYAGDIMTMPGLPSHPRLRDVDVDAHGEVTGLI